MNIAKGLCFCVCFVVYFAVYFAVCFLHTPVMAQSRGGGADHRICSSSEYSSIMQYIRSIKNAEMSFVQQDPDNKVSAGKMYIRRPGMFKLEYLQPLHYAIWVNHGKVIVYNYDTKEETSVMSSTVIAELFSNDGVAVEDYVGTCYVSDNGAAEQGVEYDVGLKKLDGDDSSWGGDVVLVFRGSGGEENRQSVGLSMIEVSDNGFITKMMINDISYPNKIDGSIFEFRNPKFYNTVDNF